ncbi:SRPBCC family protein [Psychroserpens sp. BH13MA-6]
MAHDIFFDFYIKASKKDVFDAFTLPDHLNNWWTLKSSGAPLLGTTYNLNFTDKYDWYAEVSEVEIGTHFYLKMLESDSDWDPTTFGISLEEKNERTLLKFSHTNWPKNNHHYRFSAFCWSQLLLGLKNYVEKGEVIPFQYRS